MVLSLTCFYIRDISEVAEGVDKLEKKSNVGQAIRADKISEELEGYVQSITWHVSDLKVSVLGAECAKNVGLRLLQHRFL